MKLFYNISLKSLQPHYNAAAEPMDIEKSFTGQFKVVKVNNAAQLSVGHVTRISATLQESPWCYFQRPMEIKDRVKMKNRMKIKKRTTKVKEPRAGVGMLSPKDEDEIETFLNVEQAGTEEFDDRKSVAYNMLHIEMQRLYFPYTPHVLKTLLPCLVKVKENMSANPWTLHIRTVLQY